MCRPEISPKSSPPAWSQLTILNTLMEATHLSNEVNYCCPLHADYEGSCAVASTSRWWKYLMKIAFRLQHFSALLDEIRQEFKTFSNWLTYPPANRTRSTGRAKYKLHWSCPHSRGLTQYAHEYRTSACSL